MGTRSSRGAQRPATPRTSRSSTHRLRRQVDFAVTDLANADQALTLIVDQGEGTPTDTVAQEGNLAITSAFLEIASNPGWLVPTGGNPTVRNMIFGPAALQYSQSQGALLAFFDGCFSYLLERLEADFNGNPGDLDKCVNDIMFEVIDPAITYLVTQAYDQPNLPQSGQYLTPCFRYVPTGYPDTTALQNLYGAMDSADQHALKPAATTLGLEVASTS